MSVICIIRLESGISAAGKISSEQQHTTGSMSTSPENISGNLTLLLESNVTSALWNLDLNDTAGFSNTTDLGLSLVTCEDNSAALQELKIVTLLVIGAVGAVIIGCLLFCMCYKNERILATIPGTKEYKRKQSEPVYFFPIPRLGAIRMMLEQGNNVSFLAEPSALERGLLGPSPRTKRAKAALKGAYDVQKDRTRLTVEQEDGSRSDRSSEPPEDSDLSPDEYESFGKTFPGDGRRNVKKKRKTKGQDRKRVKRVRRKNKFSTTILSKGSTQMPNAAGEDSSPGATSILISPEVNYMSRF